MMSSMSSFPQHTRVEDRTAKSNANFAHRSPLNFEPIDPEIAWQKILARDSRARFFYAVTTTGVVCRPGCASRRPLRTNVRFFSTVEQALSAGFRPCRRCRPTTAWGSPLDESRKYIEAHLDRPVRLIELAHLVGLSPFTVQRLFKRSMGVSPLQYQRAMRVHSLRKALKQGEPVTHAIYNSGFGSSSRAYDGAPLGMAPARFAQGGRGENIAYTAARTPFGWIIVGATDRGLCWLSLAGTRAEAEATLREEFPAATLHRDPSLSGWVNFALAAVSGAGNASEEPATLQELALDLRGTAFQLRIWQALRQIPRGQTRSYSQLARELGHPKATRAVARACALNRVSLLVPCHRVVGVSGAPTGYRWGIERKTQLLAAENQPR